MSNKVKLAVMKAPGHIPGGGFHYMLHPMKMTCEAEASIFELMGYNIIEVDEETADRLIKSAMLAINHQVEIAYLAEAIK